MFSKKLEQKSTDATVIEAIKRVPTTPTETLFSRRRQPVEIRGDAIVFPLEQDTTNPAFVHTIRSAQQVIFDLIEKDLDLVGKKWADKESRHRDKAYKRHKKLHLSFLSTIPPCSVKEYEEKQRERTPKKMAQAHQALNNFLNHTKEVTGSVKECKLNPDGHIVVRVDIHAANAMFLCKDQLGKIFGGSYNRYDDPEKQKTLAAVIGVVDYEKLSALAKNTLEAIIRKLESDLKAIGSISLLDIEWIEYNKRTLSPNSRLSVYKFQRNIFTEYNLKLFEAISDKHELPFGLSQSIINEGISALKQVTDKINLPQLKLERRNL